MRHMMAESLAGHVSGDLVVKLNECGVHEGKLLHIGLVGFNLEVPVVTVRTYASGRKSNSEQLKANMLACDGLILEEWR